QTRFQQALLLERIAYLHRRPVFARFLRHLARGKRRSRHPIAPCFGPDIKYRVTNSARRAASQLFVPQNSQTKNVNQWISLEAFVEINLAADGRNADAIAVVRNARNHTQEKATIGCNL